METFCCHGHPIPCTGLGEWGAVVEDALGLPSMYLVNPVARLGDAVAAEAGGVQVVWDWVFAEEAAPFGGLVGVRFEAAVGGRRLEIRHVWDAGMLPGF